MVTTLATPTTRPSPPEVLTGRPGRSGERAARRAPGPAVVVLASLMAFSVTAAFFAAFAYGLSGLQEQRSQFVLYEEFRSLLPGIGAVAPAIGGAISPGTPVALLTAPAAGLHHVVVVEGTSSGDLLAGPGHLRDSPLPGQAGQSVVMGKSATAGAPFSGLTRLHAGDRITVTTGEGTFHYVVEDSRIAGDRLPNLPKSGSLLTLVTATGSGVLGQLLPSRIFYVDAALVGTTAGTPAGRPIAVPPDEIQGHGDPSAWPFVIFWLQALILAGLGSVWLFARWGRWQTWLVATPILFGVLFGLSNELLRLLPNLY